jgi:hypothetical protein
MWNDHPNILAGVNNTIKFNYNSITYLMTLQSGLYQADDIVTRVKELLINESLPGDLFKFLPDYSTSYCTFELNSLLSFSIDFDAVENKMVHDLLGFTGTINSVGLTSNPLVDKYYESTNKIQLNVVNSILIHASFANSGYFNSRSGSDICCSIPIRVAPLNQIVFEPNHPQQFKIYHDILDMIDFSITNEANVPYITNENISINFEFYTQD